MKFQKFTALLLAVLLVLSLAACGTKDNGKKADMSSNDSAMTDEQKNAEEALALHKKLMEQENTILSQNTALWEKVFMAADKGMTLQEDGKNYGEFLLDTIEGAKDQFTDEEYEMLKESATEISKEQADRAGKQVPRDHAGIHRRRYERARRQRHDQSARRRQYAEVPRI